MKKNNKGLLSFRTKAEIILIAALFISICASSAWSTVTMTDKTTTTDDSGLVINFEEGWVNVWNATIDNESVDGTVIGQWNTAFGWGDHSTQNYFDTDTNTIDDIGNGSWGIIATSNNRTQWESGGTSDDLSDNDTDDLSEGATNLYCTLANIRARVLGQWLNFNNLTINGEAVTSTTIGNWDNAFGWGDYSVFETWFNTTSLSTIDSTLMASWNASVTSGAPSLALIRNSNNNSWAATGANIQVALDDLNETDERGGAVWLPRGDYTTTETIYIYYNMSVIGEPRTTISPDDDFDVFRMYMHSNLEKVVIDISGVGAYSNTNAAIRFWNPAGEYEYAEGFDFPTNRVVRDISVVSEGQRGIGLLLQPNHNLDAFAFNYVEHFKVSEANTTIKLWLDHEVTYINFNTFKDIKGVDCSYNIWLFEDTLVNEISMNSFDGIKYEAEGCGDEHYPIYLQGNCDMNTFSGYSVMDWGDGLTYAYVRVENYGGDTSDKNYFSGSTLAGGRIDDDTSVGNNAYVGYNATFKAINLGSGVDGGINPGWSSDDGLLLYKGTSENPKTFVYGDVSGSEEYSYFETNSLGDFCINTFLNRNIGLFSLNEQNQVRKLRIGGCNYDSGSVKYLELGYNSSAYKSGGYITTTSGDLNLSSLNDVVTIDDVLVLSGRTTNPTTLYDGMIWYNITTDLFYGRAAGATYTFNMTAV